MDLNYMWDEDGMLVQDFPVFLGHNPLIVPETTPPMERDPFEKEDAVHFYDPLMWNNMAGVAQFAEGVQLVLDCARELLLNAPTSYVPLTNWVSRGYIGALQFAGDKAITDFDFVDLLHVSDETFSKYWSMIEYTLKFARGDGLTDAEERIFRSEGKAVWTTSTPPEEGLPLTEEDLRSNLNFLNLRIETDELLFFVMVNQLYTVISENEPTNHLHSILIKKNLINPDHACIGKMENDYTDPLCVPPSQQPTPEPEPVRVETMSAVFRYETSLWDERSLKGKATLNINAFDEGLLQLSKDSNNLGITARIVVGSETGWVQGPEEYPVCVYDLVEEGWETIGECILAPDGGDDCGVVAMDDTGSVVAIGCDNISQLVRNVGGVRVYSQMDECVSEQNNVRLQKVDELVVEHGENKIELEKKHEKSKKRTRKKFYERELECENNKCREKVSEKKDRKLKNIKAKFQMRGGKNTDKFWKEERNAVDMFMEMADECE